MTWLGGRRARAYRMILLLAALCMAAGMIVTARAGIDAAGKPIGTDFIAFWSASKLALAGNASDAYDLGRLYAVERGAMPVDPGLSSFLYPPPFLLLCLPLGLAPYFVSLVVWLAVTGATYVLMLRQWLGQHVDAAKGAVFTILAYPGFLMNAGHGQNGFLTASLVGGGLWLLDRRPWVAGALLGALVIKPQIAFAIPILMLASGRWRVIVAGAVSAVMLCAASWLVLGSGAWLGFLAGGGTARGILEQGLVEPGKMVSVFAGVQVLHGGVVVGYLAQAVVAVMAGMVLIFVARQKDALSGGHAAVCAAAGTLMSPFFLDYDLTVMAIPLAWLMVEGLRRGFLPWEKAVLASGFVLPLVARDLALFAGVPIGPIVMIALLFACARAAVWRAA